MKKGLIYLLVLVMGATCLTSCEDDDDNNSASEYTGSALKLSINGKEIADKTVTLQTFGNEAGTLTLQSVIPGEDALPINVTLTEADKTLSFEGKNTTNDSETAVSGTIKNGVMNLAVTPKIKTAGVVGAWRFTYVQNPDNSFIHSPIYLNITTTIDSITFPLGNVKIPVTGKNGLTDMIAMLSSFALPMLAPKIELMENGNLVATYLSTETEEYLTTPEGLIRYNIKGKTIFIAIDINALIPRAEGPDIITMLSKGLPLQLKFEDDLMMAYVDKDMIVPFLGLLQALKPLLEGDLPPALGDMGMTSEGLLLFIDEISHLIVNSEAVELGLTITPIVPEVTPSSINMQAVKEKLSELKK